MEKDKYPLVRLRRQTPSIPRYANETATFAHPRTGKASPMTVPTQRGISPRPVNPVSASSSMLKKPLLPPPIYRPQQAPSVFQAKIQPVQPSPARKSPQPLVPPPAYVPESKLPQPKSALISGTMLRSAAPMPAFPIIQRMEQKGIEGGKGGVWYGSLLLTYSQEEIDQALEDLGLSGVKGHFKGESGSGESGQTKKEMKLLVKKLQENRAKAKSGKECVKFHHNKRNFGRQCPHCGNTVDD